MLVCFHATLLLGLGSLVSFGHCNWLETCSKNHLTIGNLVYCFHFTSVASHVATYKCIMSTS